MHPSRVLGIFVSIGLVALATVALLPARSAGTSRVASCPSPSAS